MATNHTPVADTQFTRDDFLSSLADSLPRTIWIELTSKCPFDCIFCSRKHERGTGEHMEFGLYESLIGQLESPEVIRLNYSGESLHYPRLAEAIGLARRTGATTEIVSALGSAHRQSIKALVDAGLHRLSISIHSMDSDQYRRIYGRGSIEDVRDRLEYLRSYQSERSTTYPEVDFAFVAIEENLAELPALVEYARALQVKQISIHPVIRRSAIPSPFSQELDGAGNLRIEFAARLKQTVDAARQSAPDLNITVARPQAANRTKDAAPSSGITTCEQNPWSTIHVLSNGDVVVCEVQDRVAIGSLRDRTLRGIWNGTEYTNFRREYLTGSHAACSLCPWRSTATELAGGRVLLRGWHPTARETVRWSESNAALAVVVPPGVSGLRVSGILPPPPAGTSTNSLSIRLGPEIPASIVNRTSELMPFEAQVACRPRKSASTDLIRFEVKEPFCPAERGRGADLRRLGFAMTGLSFEFSQQRRKQVNRLLNLLERVESASALRRITSRIWPVPAQVEPGICVLVPARDTPDLLDPTLQAAEASLAHVSEAADIVVIVSGTDGANCAHLARRYRRVKWVFRREPLHYVQAVQLGLQFVRQPWVYLLNSDMLLNASAIPAVMEHRRPETFAIGSRIKMADGSSKETNWTDLRYGDDGGVELIERDPQNLGQARGCLYVGGGSGLFRASLLRKFVRGTGSYAPFYWEDVEWGARAWRYGYECVFCPASEVVHGFRQTVSRYYDEREVARVFERNRLLFHLRNLRGVRCLEERLLSLDEQSWNDVFQSAALFETVSARARSFIGPRGDGAISDRWAISY